MATPCPPKTIMVRGKPRSIPQYRNYKTGACEVGPEEDPIYSGQLPLSQQMGPLSVFQDPRNTYPQGDDRRGTSVGGGYYAQGESDYFDEAYEGAYRNFFDAYKRRSYEADVETFNRSLMRTDVGIANSILKKLLDQWNSGIEEIQNPFYEGEENLVDFNEENNLSPLQEKTLAWKSAFPVTWRILSSIFGDDMSRSVDRPNFTTGHTDLFGSSPPEDEEASVDSEFDDDDPFDSEFGGDNQGPLGPNVPGDSPPEAEGPTEEEAFLDSILEGFNNEEIRQQNEETLTEFLNSVGFAEGEWDSVLGRKTDEEEYCSLGALSWGERDCLGDDPDAYKQVDIDKAMKDALDRLPGVGVVFEDGKMKGRILIPIPGLPTSIQGSGFEFEILDNGRLVITANVRNKITEIKDFIKSLPEQIRSGIDSTIESIREAGEEIGDIFTDNDGNIFVNVVDAAGSILRRVAVTVGGLLDGSEGKAGLLGWLLSSGIIGSAVDGAKERFFPFAEGGEDDGAGTGDGTGDDGQPQEEPPPEDEKKGPPVTGDEGPLDDEDTSTGESPSDEEPLGDDDLTGTPPEDTSDDDPFDGSGSSEGTPEDTSDDDPFDGSGSSEGTPEDTSDDGPTGGGGNGNGGVDPDPDDVEPEEDEPVTGGGGGGGGEQEEDRDNNPFYGTGMLGGGGSGTGYMDNLGYGLPQFVAVPYQLKDYNVELNRLINDSLFKGII